MKYILILLVISFAFGQNIEEALFYIDDRGISSRVITIDDILNYAEECYNDTIEDYIDMGGYTMTVECDESGENCVGTREYDIYYTYRKPTFEGFIEWINK